MLRTLHRCRRHRHICVENSRVNQASDDERLLARPGDDDYGFLSVRTQTFAVARMLFAVKPGAFVPPPKVDSAVTVPPWAMTISRVR